MVNLIVRQTGSPIPNKVWVGTNHVPIQAAIDYANSEGGGTVFIEKGTYDINSTRVRKGLDLYSNIKLCGEYFGTKLVPSFPATINNAVISCVGTVGNELTNITVEALLIGGISTAVGQIGIYCSYVGLAQTTGLASGGYDASTVGKDKPNKIGICVKNCIIQSNNNRGIWLISSSNNTITGNTFQNNANGIWLDSSLNNTITGNTFQNNNSGIFLDSSSNNTITGNTVQNNNYEGVRLAFSSSNNTITGNTVQNNTDGIWLNDSSNNNTITGNTCQNNGNGGMEPYNSSNNTITGNTIQNHWNFGMCLGNSSNNNTITGNTFQNNNMGIWLKNFSNNNTITGNKYTNIQISGTGNLNSLSYNQVIA